MDKNASIKADVPLLHGSTYFTFEYFFIDFLNFVMVGPEDKNKLFSTLDTNFISFLSIS